MILTHNRRYTRAQSFSNSLSSKSYESGGFPKPRIQVQFLAGVPTPLKNRKQAFVKTLSFPWIQDGLRHTFCTFHCAKHRNIEELLRQTMGNSPAVIDRFYKGAIGKVEVEKFWRIVPKSEEKPSPGEKRPPVPVSGSAQLRTEGSGIRRRGR